MLKHPLTDQGIEKFQKKEYRSVLLPSFEFKEIDGAINPRETAIRIMN